MKEKIKGYGAKSETSPLEEMTIERRELQENDVKIKITYCGVCHSDIHTVENDWEGSKYPVIPGHEIIGRVVEVGS
ncbi:MAG: alcohol dehydrogenase catalytic domain-containing protein, partial [Flavobacteriaceae bacterium]|nr:alcohol dehydrogenase catalytic domain-containing protein [Flavobacteriaceae bacterium]